MICIANSELTKTDKRIKVSKIASTVRRRQMNHRSQLSVQRSISLYNTRTHACTRPPRSVSPCPHCIVPIVMSRSRLVKPRSHRTNWTELNEATRLQQASIDNESVPKIIINNAINLSYKTAISILLISNHNSLQVLFDKNWFRVFYLKNIFIFYHWKLPAQRTSTEPVVSAHFCSPLIIHIL